MIDAKLIVRFAKEFGWTLEEIGKLTPNEAREFNIELDYQDKLRDYIEMARFAFLASVLVNLWSKSKVSPRDFVGEIPTRDGESDLINQARTTRRKRRVNDQSTVATSAKTDSAK